ncbi:MAG: CDP-diacylglycerol--glycerol-3-phosphate 3-phosphatidyltransferase [Clostridia bacterium]|nr:CDP-diacylglycerol--glycerol-3-phosphate 3-phosphatidyltransferase [Clostridia bacterium]MEE1125043.1 CDP-diacylglycerol--glycerol-3-phosphate 3-phosphatidyltransferase [Acutalibacteraceae bacterium]
MNLPNKLTLLRILLVPFFVAFLLIEQIPFSCLWALVVFIIASITDFFDGYIARKHNMITDFGKFADPLADKILVISAFCCFIQMGLIGAVPVIIVLFREFAITSVRLIAATKGTVVAANMWGKAKTVSQMIAIILTIFLQAVLQLMGNNDLSSIFGIITDVVVWVSVALTIISGVVYLKDNADLYKNAK